MPLIGQRWKAIEGYPDYEISDDGVIVNVRTGREMRTSVTQHGHVKVSLRSPEGRRTLSVAVLLASAYCRPPNPLSNGVIVLNGDLSDLRADNLAWRPRWFCWKYREQLFAEHPRHVDNLPVLNHGTRTRYDSIREAGMVEGLLFADVWRSTYTGETVFPTNYRFVALDET